MPRGHDRKLNAPAGEERVWPDEEGFSAFARERGKSLIDLAARAGFEHVHLPLHGARSRLRLSRRGLRTPGIARIDEHATELRRVPARAESPCALALIPPSENSHQSHCPPAGQYWRRDRAPLGLQQYR